MYAPRRESAIEEVVRSQRAMIDRLATKTAALDSAQVKRGLRAHREDIRRWAVATPHVDLLEIDYPSLQDPAAAVSRLVEFVGKEKLSSEQSMAEVIDPALHRQRKQI